MRNYADFMGLNHQKYYDMYVHLTIYETEILLKYCALDIENKFRNFL